MRHNLSLRAKLVAIVMTTTCVSLLLMAFAFGLFEYVSYRKAMTAEMATIESIIGANSTAALSFNDKDTADEILGALQSLPEVRSACLYDAQRRIFASYLRPNEQCPAASTPDGSKFDSGVLAQTTAVVLESARIGTLRVVVTREALWRRLKLSGAVLALVLALSVLAGLLLSSRLEGVVSKPILELATTARRIADQRDYALRAPQHSDDEVGVAVGAFNEMLDHIQNADRAVRQAGQRSLEQARFLSSILDNMGEGMIVVDRYCNVLVWNAAAARIIGPKPTGVDVRDWPRHFRLLPSANEPLIESSDLPIVRALRGNATTDMEIYLEPTEHRSARWINVTAHPLLDEQGTITGAISVFRDATLQKQAELELRTSEEQLRQAQKMDAVGQLAGGIAHDFNNLLTVICGYSGTALALLPPNEPVRKEIEEVLNAGQRAATLTRQLLAFSRKHVVTLQPLDLNAVVNNAEKMLRRLIGENVELSVVYGADLGQISSDPGLIDQVLVNLAVNARDAMPQGGRLTLETANAELDEQYAHEHVGVRAGPYVRLSVSDSGIGMSADVQSHMFEPFFTTKSAGKGSGLGLSIVYGIIQQSCGHITVRSAQGQGSSFDIYLPRISRTEPPIAPPSSSNRDVLRGTETVLVVEDEAPVRKLVSEALANLGYKVLVASDGVEALSVQAEYPGPIHLLVTDVVMPRMSGTELAKILSEKLPTLRILFMTGYTGEARFHQSLAEGELTLVQKPFTLDVLAGHAREVLDRRKP